MNKEKMIRERTDSQFLQNVLKDIHGEKINHSWRDAGTIFFEIGRLTHREGENNPCGKYSFMIDYPWRFEKDTKIICSSDLSSEERDDFIKGIVGKKVRSVDFINCSKDLVIEFNDTIFRQFSLDLDMHSWSLRVENDNGKYFKNNSDHFWLSFEDNKFCIEYENE